MKRNIRRICGIILGVLMMTGLFSSDALASDPLTPTDRIGSHYAADDSTGALSDAPEITGDTSKSWADGRVKTDKTISAGENENEFLITLDVRTGEEIHNIELSEDAAAVIVTDLSGSMNDGNKLANAKRAALAFVEKFAETENPDAVRKIAVVGFSGQRPQSGWGGSLKGITAATVYQPWTDASDNSVASKINEMNAEGGTCLQAGLVLAKNLLDSEETAGISNKNIILLTDGNPTYYLSDDAARSRSTESVGEPDQIRGSGRDTDHATHMETELTAKSVLESGVNVYGVFLGSEKVECSGRGCRMQKTGSQWLSEDCGFTVCPVDEAEDLLKAFENISEQIRIQAKAWMVEDPMGDMFDFIGFVNEPQSDDEYSYSASSDKVLWNLRLSEPVSKTEDGFSVYRLTYKVRLNTLASDYKAGVYYPTNGITSVTYMLEKEARGGRTEITSGTAYFNVPSAKGYAADISFHKADNNNKALAGATFDLYYGETLMDTAVSDENGSVLFKNIPSGHSYTVVERTAPDGFVTDDRKYDVRVSYGSVDGEIGTDNTVINMPEPEHGSIIVSKTISGAGASADEEFTFTLTLSDTSVNGKHGDMTFVNGEAVFTLKANESKTAAELPEGVSYTVTESEIDGYTPSVNGVSTASATGRIVKDSAEYVAFDNFYHGGRIGPGGDPESGNIRFDITKTVQATGDVIPAGQNRFEFVVSTSLDEADSVMDDNPVIEIYGTGTQTKTVALDMDEIPRELYVWEKTDDASVEWTYDTTVYRITFTEDDIGGEAVPRYERLDKAGNGEEYTAVESASFINSFYATSAPYYGLTGNMQISKTVINGDKTKEFTFTVTLTTPDGEKISGRYGEMMFINGTADVSLMHGESAAAVGIPADTMYTVEEIDNEGYRVTVNGNDGASADGAIEAGKTVTLEFQNDKDGGDVTPGPEPGDTGNVKVAEDHGDAGSAPASKTSPSEREKPDMPRTGDLSEPGLWIAIGVLSLLGAAASVFNGKRRHTRKY